MEKCCQVTGYMINPYDAEIFRDSFVSIAADDTPTPKYLHHLDVDKWYKAPLYHYISSNNYDEFIMPMTGVLYCEDRDCK